MENENELISTDEAILDSIGEGDEQTTATSTTEEGVREATDAEKEASTASSEQGTDGSGDKEQQQKPAGPQDLVDANGNLIASGGKERRFYETAQREKVRADQATNKITQLEGQLKAITDAGTVGTQYGLSPDEVTTGAQLIASYKKNPVETIQYMLTQAQSNGHNIDAIQAGGVDMNAVKQMLDNALAPLVGDRQERIDTQETEARAKEIYNNFSSKFPDASVHENSLSRLLKDDPSLSVEAAYYKLQAFYAQKGLDWTKPLETLQQEATAKNTSADTRSQPPESNVNSNNTTDRAQVADVSTSTSDIIRDAMREAGIN